MLARWFIGSRERARAGERARAFRAARLSSISGSSVRCGNNKRGSCNECIKRIHSTFLSLVNYCAATNGGIATRTHARVCVPACIRGSLAERWITRIFSERRAGRLKPRFREVESRWKLTIGGPRCFRSILFRGRSMFPASSRDNWESSCQKLVEYVVFTVSLLHFCINIRYNILYNISYSFLYNMF